MTRNVPRVVLVGGPDVDARLELMGRLRPSFELAAVGSLPAHRARFAAAGFPYESYRLSRKVNPIADLLSMGQLARHFRRVRPQIVHAFDTKPGVWGCLAARLAGVPLVIGTITGLGSLYGGNGIKTRATRTVYEALQALACRASDATIFQNHDDARQLVSAGVVSADRAVVVPGSGVPTEIFDPDLFPPERRAGLRRDLGIDAEETVVTMVSRVIRSKGVPEFVAAARGVRQALPGTRFLLIGPPDDQSVDRLGAGELEQLRREVTWIGPRRDIPALLAVSDVFVLPSAYREGIPRVLLEAAAMGLPIVTTDSPGCNDVVESGVNGFLVPIHDPAALARAIGQLVSQPDLRRRLGSVSRQRAVESFDLAVIAAQTGAVYRRLISEQKRPKLGATAVT